MAALVLTEGAEFDAEKFKAFLAEQPDLGPKQWPSFVRVGVELPRTETFKVIKRQLQAEGTDCADPVWRIAHVNRNCMRSTVTWARGLPRVSAAHRAARPGRMRVGG